MRIPRTTFDRIQHEQFRADIIRHAIVTPSDLIIAQSTYEQIAQKHATPPTQTEPRGPRHPIRGVGDLVALVAKPIARGIDALTGTDLEHCPGCDNRQEWLNQKLPLGTPPAP